MTTLFKDSDTPVASVVELAAARYPHLEVWRNQFRLRGREFELLNSEAPVPRCRRILEVGCGNGLTAALLAPFASSMVVATDLLEGNPETSSQGLAAPRELLDSVGVSNCKVLACTAAALPFADESFDLVFSGYTLEHLVDPIAALREMRRVLVPGGKLYLVLPTTVERLTYLLSFYQYLGQRAWWHMRKRFSLGPAEAVPRLPSAHGEGGVAGRCGTEAFSTSKTAGEASRMMWRYFRERHPDFPWPQPHGAYPHYLSEVVTYHPWRWKRLIGRSGFRLLKQFTTILFPYHLMGLLTDPFPWFLRWSQMVHLTQGWPVLRSLGNNVCFVAEKA